MGKNKAPHQPDARGSGYSGGLPHCVYDSAAYRTASHREKALLSAILRSFNGYNNGTIAVSRDLLAERIDSRNHAANRVAIAGLLGRGLIKVTTFPRGARKAQEFELTWISTGTLKHQIRATHEYLQWRVGDAGTGKKRRSIITQRRIASGSITDREGKCSSSATEPQCLGNGPSSSSAIEQHILYQEGARRSGLSATAGNGGGRFRATPQRPQSMSEDQWIVAGRRASENPAGPSAEDLRDMLQAFIEECPRGAQTRLAKAVGIPGGTLSKFIHGRLDLDNLARVSIATALPRLRTSESRRAA